MKKFLLIFLIILKPNFSFSEIVPCNEPKCDKKFVNNYYGKQIDEIVWLVDNGTHGFDGDPKKGTFKYRDIGKNITTTTNKKLGDEYREKTVNYFKSIFNNN